MCVSEFTTPFMSATLTAVTNRMTCMEAQPFRLLLLRRLRLPVPLTSRTCRCGTPLAIIEQRAVWRGPGGKGGFHLYMLRTGVQRSRSESEDNTFVRDMDLEGVNVLDGRRLEVVADGLTLWHGAQLANDTTLVSPLHRDGTARRRAVDRNRAAKEEGHAWWCSLQKFGGGGSDGPKSLLSSCALSSRLTPRQHPKSSRTASKRHGSADGATSWIAVRPGLLRCLSWTSTRIQELGLRCTRC